MGHVDNTLVVAKDGVIARGVSRWGRLSRISTPSPAPHAHTIQPLEAQLVEATGEEPPSHPRQRGDLMVRTVEQVDRDLDVERAIWIMERRAGDHCPEAEASWAKIEELLDERSAAQRASHRVPS